MAASDNCGVEYRLVEAHELPFVDVSRSLKKSLLSPAGRQIYKSACKRLNLICTIMYTVAFPIGASVLTVPTEHARILAIFKFLFQVPMLIMTSAGLRLDLLWCLVTTYEFWFFTTVNAATCVMLSLHLGDQRMILAPVYWYGIQMNIWADAKVQGSQLASAAALAAVYHVFLLVVFGMQLTPDVQLVKLIRHAGHSMTSSDFLMNSFTTMTVLMVRTAYRKRALHRRSGDDPRVLRFVSYRCRVRFQRLDNRTSTSAVGSPSSNYAQHGPSSRLMSAMIAPENASEVAPTSQAPHHIRGGEQVEPHPTAQRLRYVQSPTTFRSSSFIVPSIAKLFMTRTRWCVPLLYAVGALGLGIHVGVYVCIYLSLQTPAPESKVFVPLSLLGLACTSLFVGAFAACHQRQLVLRLLSSFDFLFLSLQITLGCISVCVIVDWDARCYTLPIAWLWLHWVLTLDALTPTVKAALQFRSCFAIPVLLFAVIMQIVSSAHILNHASDAVYERVFWSFTLFRHKVVIRVVPFFLSRGLTILLWLLRILWRLFRSDDGELTMIQGSVEFFGNPKALRRAAAAVATEGSGSAKPALVRHLSRVVLGSTARIQPG